MKGENRALFLLASLTPQYLSPVPIVSVEELDEIDRFIAEPKTLVDQLPAWTPSARPPDWEAKWGILDSIGIERAHLRFRFIQRDYPSISLIFRSNPLWRLDLAPSTICKPNPLTAARLGLPHTVCGTHEHTWHHNRAHVGLNGFGSLPIRSPLHPQLRRLPQALADFARRINLTITPDQRGFDIPPQGSLDV